VGKTIQKLAMAAVASVLAIPCVAKSGKDGVKTAPAQTSVGKQRNIVNKAGNKDKRIGIKTGSTKGPTPVGGGGPGASGAMGAGKKALDDADAKLSPGNLPTREGLVTTVALTAAIRIRCKSKSSSSIARRLTFARQIEAKISSRTP
jgi:hypothetical protein